MTPLRNANAERQARHRERVKEKLRNAYVSAPLRNVTDVRRQMGEDIVKRLRQAYRGQIDVFRRQINGTVIDPYADDAVTEFEAEADIEFEDIIMMVEMAGYSRLTELFSLHCLGSERDAGEPEWIRHKAQLQERGVT